MRKCELCGAEIPKELETCSRCGFEFRRELRADARDEAVLERHKGKTVKVVNRDLKNRRTQLRAYLENLAAKSLSMEEVVSLINESLAFLQIPLEMGVEDTLVFDRDEKDFINLVAAALEDTDKENGTPTGATGTYIKLSNALHFLDQQDRAMRMIDQALLINPRDRSALLAKSMLLFFRKRYQPAKRCLEKLISEKDDEKARYLIELIDQIS